MGILKSREELLPVTCAILKDEDRDHFFADARKKAGGNMDRLARICAVPVSVIQDWVNGTVHIPYHALQRLAQELEVELPSVSELRREYQLVVHAPAPRRREPPPPPPEPKRKKERQPKKEAKKPARAPRPPRQRRQAKAQPSEQQRRSQQQPKAPKAPGPGGPKLSDKLAYWTAVLFTAARYEGTAVVLSADRRIGQNFAATWANLTNELFGRKPALSMSEDRKVQQATLQAEGLEDFLSRLEFKPGAGPGEAPGAPRWAWSNPAWKTAFVKGVVDASAHFHRAPSLSLRGLSPRLSQSVQKILASLGFSPKPGPEQSLTIEGRDQVEKYFSGVGTGNMKLKDQFKAFQGGRPEPAQREEPQAESAAEAPPAEPAEEDLSVGPGNELPPEEVSQPEPEDLSVGPGNELHPKPKPSPRPQHRRRRRTAYRGRPGSR